MDLKVVFDTGTVLVDVAVINPLCATHVRASAKDAQGAVIKKERAKIAHHIATSKKFEMEIVLFVVDTHGSHGPDARKFLKRMAQHRPRPRLSGQHPLADYYAEMAASGVAILRAFALTTRLAFSDAHTVRRQAG